MKNMDNVYYLPKRSEQILEADKTDEKMSWKQRLGVAIAIGSIAVAGMTGYQILNHSQELIPDTTAEIEQTYNFDFNTETQTVSIEKGAGVASYISKIDGVNELPDTSIAIDYVEAMPENQSLFENGRQLQPDDILTLPISVEAS